MKSFQEHLTSHIIFYIFAYVLMMPEWDGFMLLSVRDGVAMASNWVSLINVGVSLVVIALILKLYNKVPVVGYVLVLASCVIVPLSLWNLHELFFVGWGMTVGLLGFILIYAGFLICYFTCVCGSNVVSKKEAQANKKIVYGFLAIYLLKRLAAVLVQKTFSKKFYSILNEEQSPGHVGISPETMGEINRLFSYEQIVFLVIIAVSIGIFFLIYSKFRGKEAL